MVFLTALGMLHGKSKKEPNFVFVHGLMQNSKDAGYYESKTFNILPGKTVLIDFPCTENMPQRISNPVKLSLGQAYEIKSLAKACRRIQAPTVLVGLSMGAATILNYTATHRNRHIKALVVEAPFDHIGTVVRNITMGLLSKEK